MRKLQRYRFPPWIRHCLLILERCTLPILIFQTIRTLLIPTTFDVLLLGMLILLFLAFHLEWI